MTRRKSTVPVCAACGRKLRAFPRADAQVRTDPETNDPRHNGPSVDGAPRTRGDYGDNLVCAMKCGYTLAIRLVLADPGVLDLLPPEWRHRSAATVRDGKPDANLPAALRQERDGLVASNKRLRDLFAAVVTVVHHVDRLDELDTFRKYFDHIYKIAKTAQVST